MSFNPHHNPCQRIEDMLEAIASIRESVKGVTYEQFVANREKRQSVAYDIEVIGEAANAIARDVQNKYPAIPWSDFIGMRNVLIPTRIVQRPLFSRWRLPMPFSLAMSSPFF